MLKEITRFRDIPILKCGAGKTGVPEIVSCKLLISWLKKLITYLIFVEKVTGYKKLSY